MPIGRGFTSILSFFVRFSNGTLGFRGGGEQGGPTRKIIIGIDRARLDRPEIGNG